MTKEELLNLSLEELSLLIRKNYKKLVNDPDPKKLGRLLKIYGEKVDAQHVAKKSFYEEVVDDLNRGLFPRGGDK